MPVISALRRLGQEDHGFEATLGCAGYSRPASKIPKRKKNAP
jgi:hypothetical protein